ncbi:protein tyrosine phosphatase [Variovorax sp. JS1663]|nr:protein tyrosine phosphatase [Variovorax sp. JS1663]
MQNRIGVIFVSRRDTLRSVLAKACLSHIDDRRFRVESCGHPRETGSSPHPAALAALREAGMAMPGRAPRNWLDFVPSRGFQAEFVITLDADVLSSQPNWPGQPNTALWSYPDAAAIKDPEQARRTAVQILYSLRRRLELLSSLPLGGADREALRSDLRDLGHMG